MFKLRGLREIGLSVAGDNVMASQMTVTVSRGTSKGKAKFTFEIYDGKGDGRQHFLPSVTEILGSDGSTAVHFHLPVLSDKYIKPYCKITVEDIHTRKSSSQTVKIRRK